MNTEREMLKLESLNREEEAESLKLEEKVYLDFRDLKSEELNLKWILGRRDIEKKNLLIFFFWWKRKHQNLRRSSRDSTQSVKAQTIDVLIKENTNVHRRTFKSSKI